MLTASWDTTGSFSWAVLHDYMMLNDGGYKIRNAGSDYVIAAGGFSNLTDADYLILRYRSNGALLSSSSASGSANGFDEIADIATDNNGNIYVTGGVINPARRSL